MRVLGSAQTTSETVTLPTEASSSPALASGARARVKVGLRTSPSIKRHRAPLCAIRDAIPAAIVDLPSLGKLEVRPIILVGLGDSFRSTVSLIARIASA